MVFRSVPVKQDELTNTPMKKELYLGLDVHSDCIAAWANRMEAPWLMERCDKAAAR